MVDSVVNRVVSGVDKVVPYSILIKTDVTPRVLIGNYRQ